jgi:hypothetical protein
MGRRRIVSGALACVIGLAGALVVASPAYAKGAEQRIRKAIVATQAEEATGFTMTMTMDVDGQTLDAFAEGAMTLDEGDPLGSITITMTTPAGDQVTMEERIVDGDIYVDMSDLASIGADVPGLAEQPWVRMSIKDAIGGVDPTAGTDPSSQLDVLEGIDDAQRVGREDVDGVPTTHYEGTVDLEKTKAQLPRAQRELIDQAYGDDTEIPVGVWIDDENRVRRMSMEFDTEIQGREASVEMEMEMSDFGGTVDVQAPPEDQVLDFSEVFGTSRA